ncbi:MAG TPA: hypothetical protein VMR70_21255 [Flavisolibacter sp.]|nr:hypothetical protein [Flavisolibacter sp.]
MLYRLSFLLTAFFLLLHTNAFSQVAGCKDPAATNYNPSATTNNGSCTYPATSYSPPVKVDPLSATLQESSGLQMADNFLWSFNDGGATATIYRLDTSTGNILQTVTLDGATNVDWEDMAFDGTHFYIGDFGNNANGVRTDLKIYKFALSAIPSFNSDPVATVPASAIEVINFSYSDQTSFTPTAANSTAFDCEAMLVVEGKIHLFTKNWLNLSTTHYTIPSTAAGTYSATPLETLQTNYLVTSADVTPNGKVVALLGYQATGFFNHYLHLLSDFNSGLFFNGNKRQINLSSAISMGQAEGICFYNNNYGYISNERISSPVTVTQKLRSFNTSSFVSLAVLPAKLQDFNVQNRNGSYQINWLFTEPVKELTIWSSTSSSNIASTKVLQTEKGSFSIPASAGKTCFTLSWKEANGSEQSSNTICLQDNLQKGMGKLVLRNNGAISFQFDASQNEQAVLRLFSADGKLLAQTNRLIVPGTNSFSFGKTIRQNMVLLQITGATLQAQKMVMVQQ